MDPNSIYRPDIKDLRTVAVLDVMLHQHFFAPLMPGGCLLQIAIDS